MMTGATSSLELGNVRSGALWKEPALQVCFGSPCSLRGAGTMHGEYNRNRIRSVASQKPGEGREGPPGADTLVKGSDSMMSGSG